MTDSLRSDPRRIRAARRAAFPHVRARRPGPERHHPASVAEVRAALRRAGEEVYYGIRLVELVSAPAESSRVTLGRLVEPGVIQLYDQPRSPWRLGLPLAGLERKRLCSAGAVIDAHGNVTWPGETLKQFMLRYVLLHEIGHHVLQHERRLRGRRAARSREHEARAEVIAGRLRTRTV